MILTSRLLLFVKYHTLHWDITIVFYNDVDKKKYVSATLYLNKRLVKMKNKNLFYLLRLCV